MRTYRQSGKYSTERALEEESKLKNVKKYSGRPRLTDQQDLKEIVYAPKGAALELFGCEDKEVLLDGPAGTGKSLSALHKIHLILGKYSGVKALMARKTRQSMTNSVMMTYEQRVLDRSDKVHLLKNEQIYKYPNGSIFAICGLDDPEKIKSSDWDIIYINEATECTEHDLEMCTTRLRYWKYRYQQLIADCNPDKPKHWLNVRCNKGLMTRLISRHVDNPMLWDKVTEENRDGITFTTVDEIGTEGWTIRGRAYIETLDRLSGARRSRLYLGQWVAAEGVVYEQWDVQLHMISEVDMPQGWEEWDHYWCIDWGYIHPFVWGDWVENPVTGAMYLVAQIYKTQTLTEDLARMVMKIAGASVDKHGQFVPGHYTPKAVICDHDAGDRAVFEKYTGLLTLPAYKNISTGVQNVQKRLTPSPKWGGGPGLYIVRDSLRHNKDENLTSRGLPASTEEEFDGYVWDKKKNDEANSKKDEIPVDKDNHGMDKVRYMAAFLDNLADDPQEGIEEVIELNEVDELISRY